MKNFPTLFAQLIEYWYGIGGRTKMLTKIGKSSMEPLFKRVPRGERMREAGRRNA